MCTKFLSARILLDKLQLEQLVRILVDSCSVMKENKGEQLEKEE